MLHCPCFSDAREPFQHVLQTISEKGLGFADLPVISVHPSAQAIRAMQFREPRPEIAEVFKTLADSRAGLGAPLHVYTDGSCVGSEAPTTRYAAYSCVIDLCLNDDQRRQMAHAFKSTGVMPPSLQTMCIARVQGDQTINRAELSAVQAATSLGSSVTVHSDSQYAVSVGNNLPDLLPLCHSNKLANSDIIADMCTQHNPSHLVCKINAHQNLDEITDMLELYHALGNKQADQEAKDACAKFNPPWAQQLNDMHEEVDPDRFLLKEFYFWCWLLRKRGQTHLHRSNAPMTRSCQN